MTPLRLWKVATTLKWQSPRIFSAIRYQDVSVNEQNKDRLGTLKFDDIPTMKKLLYSPITAERIVFGEQFWLHMQPDCFPSTLDSNKFIPSHLRYRPSYGFTFGRSRVTAASDNIHSGAHTIKDMPYDILILIAIRLSLPNLLSLLGTCRGIRSRMLGSPGSRNTLAHAWIHEQAQYYIPIGDNQIYISNQLGWDYLNRCLRSGSMRNRRRIFWVAQQIERIADELGV